MPVMIRSLSTRRLLVVAATSMVSLVACGSSSKSNAGATNSSAAATSASVKGGTASTAASAAKGAASTAANKDASTAAAKSGGAATTAAKGSSAGGSSGSFADDLTAAFAAVAKGDCSKAKEIGASIDASGDEAGSLTQLGALGKAMDKLASSGPSELRADFATLAKAFGALSKVYADLGVDDSSKLASALADPAKAAQFQKIGSQINAPEVQAASERISKWAEEKCPGLN